MNIARKSALAGRRIFVTAVLCCVTTVAHASGVEALFAATLDGLDGKPVELKRYEGKPLIVNFWARWCAPCRVEIPELAKTYATHKGSDLVVLGIAVEEPEAHDSVRDFAKAYEINYPLLLGENRKTLWLMQTLGNNRGGLPFTVVIDRKGQIVTRKLGAMSAAELDAATRTLLAK